LFFEVHLPLRKGYVSVEELVRELSHNKPGLFQPLSPFSLRRSIPRRGKLTTLTNLSLLITTLGASRRRLGGKPPRVTIASKAFRRESQVLKLWDALAQLTQAHKPTLRYGLNHKSHKERVGSVSMALAYEKQQGEHLSNHRTNNPNKWSSWGTYTPHKEN
jgi:hypothetical protein